jgi:hypothetical protein
MWSADNTVAVHAALSSSSIMHLCNTCGNVNASRPGGVLHNKPVLCCARQPHLDGWSRLTAADNGICQLHALV